jgi:4-amino-4-deoxy-L-arabinose transferase-like glycosyltransferase
MRLANIPLLLVALVFVWLLAGELLGRGRPQVVATLGAGLLPQLLNVTATINPDILLVAEWSAALYFMTLVVRRGPRRRWVAWLVGLCVLGLLTHGRSAPLFAAAALAILVGFARERGWRRATPLRLTLAAAALYVVAAVVAAGWGAHDNARQFVSYVWQFYLPRLGFMTAKIGPPDYGFRKGIVDRLYGTLAQLEVVLPHSVESITYWLTVIALVALVAALVHRRAAVRRNADTACVLAFTAIALVLSVHVVAYRGLADDPVDPVFTARYLLPLLPLFGAALAIIVGALPRRAGAVAIGVIFAIGVALQFESIGLLVGRFYA